MINEKPTIEGIDAEDFLNKMPSGFKQCPLIVIGDAPERWEELDELIHFLKRDFANVNQPDLMAINAAGRDSQYKIQYVATYESQKLGDPNHKKLHPGVIPKGAIVHGYYMQGFETDSINYTWTIAPAGGTSSLFGVIVGLCLGYRQIYTVGVHLDRLPWNSEMTKKYWREIWYPVIKDRVRGWSGLPKEILGDRFEKEKEGPD